MGPWASQGELLRWWRTEVLHLSQQEAAALLAVKPSALSNWERGARQISIGYEAVDELLGGTGALADLLWATGTPDGLAPRRLWTHAYQGPSSPVWMWIRSPSNTVHVVGEWGVARLEPTLDLGDGGAFITLGASVAESPIVVELSEPGWIDFGRGRLPEHIPGAAIHRAIDLLRQSSASGTFMQLFSEQVASRFGDRSSEIISFATMAPRIAAAFVVNRYRDRHDSKAVAGWPSPLESLQRPARHRFTTIRSARALSLADTVDLLVKKTDVSVSKETLRRFEAGVGQPHDPILPAALDHVLGGGGALVCDELRRDEGPGLVTFPHYWRGPIWIRFSGSSRRQVVRLHWGEWYRNVEVEPPADVWFTCSTPDASLRIEADQDLSWSIGVGHLAGARAINQNWVPASIEIARRALIETERAFVRALSDRGRKPGG